MTFLSRWATAALVATAALTLPVLTATPAQAASSIQITKVYVNAPGKDTAKNKSVNGEYVTIKNTSKKTKTLTGYSVRDESKHVYTFGSFKLKAGKSVVVHTGKGDDTGSTLYMDRGWHIWNNSGGDSATLKNADGDKLDKCSWGKKLIKSYKNC